MYLVTLLMYVHPLLYNYYYCKISLYLSAGSPLPLSLIPPPNICQSSPVLSIIHHSLLSGYSFILGDSSLPRLLLICPGHSIIHTLSPLQPSFLSIYPTLHLSPNPLSPVFLSQRTATIQLQHSHFSLSTKEVLAASPVNVPTYSPVPPGLVNTEIR